MVVLLGDFNQELYKKTLALQIQLCEKLLFGTMTTICDDHINALDRFLGPLEQHDDHGIHDLVTSGDLLRRTFELRQRYRDRTAERVLERLTPFITSLQSFSEVLDVFLQASPAPVTLLWGSVFFVLEVCSYFPALL